MSPLAALKSSFKKYFKLSGRASRSEYGWWVTYFCVMFAMSIYAISSLSGILGYQYNAIITLAVGLFFLIAALLPHFSVTTRRLHDLNKRAVRWWLLIFAVFLGFLLLAAYGILWSYFNRCSGFGCLEGIIYIVYAGIGFPPVFCLLHIILAMFKGAPGPNRFGPDPLEAQA